MNRALRITAIVLLILVLIFIIFSPGIIRNYIVNNSTELIGRKVTIEDLDINYFLMKVDIDGFTLYEDDNQTPFVSFDKLMVNLAPLYLINSEVVVQEMLLDGLDVNVIQQDSSFNFDSMISHFDSEETVDDTTVADTIEQEPTKFHLSNLEMINGAFYYLDSIIGEDVHLIDLNMFIPYIGWNQEDASDAGLKFFFTNGGYFESSFQMDPVSGIFDAELTIEDLDLSTFYGFTSGQLEVDTLKGYLNTSLSALGNTHHLDSIDIVGWLNFVELEVTSGGYKDLIYVDSLYCKIDKLQPLMSIYKFDTIQIINPSISFELYDSTNNFMAILPPDEMVENEIEVDTAIVEEYPLYYSLNQFEIINGSLDFIDHQYDNTFAYELSNIEMTLGSITSESEWVDLQTSMLLNGRGNLIADLGFNPLDPMELELQYQITEFQLSDLNIITNHYIGHDIVLGDLKYVSDVEIVSGQIVSENKLIIRDIEINKIKGGITTLPLKLAIFIITDKNGDATFDIPVRGDLNDPELSIGKLVWNTFKNFIGKIAAAPYNFLAGLVTSDPSDIQEVVYDFADTSFTPKKKRQMNMLLKLEDKKPGLNIELEYFMDMDKEKQSIAILKAGERFKASTNMDPQSNESEFLTFIRNATQNDSIDLISGAETLVGLKVIDSLAISFSNYRIQQLDHYLKRENNSTSIKVHQYRSGAPKNMDAVPYFHLKYSVDDE